jgi:hypothetical protein
MLKNDKISRYLIPILKKNDFQAGAIVNPKTSMNLISFLYLNLLVTDVNVSLPVVFWHLIGWLIKMALCSWDLRSPTSKS